MSTPAISEIQAHEPHSISPKAILGITVLVVFTVLITWRAHLLELTVKEESDQPTLVNHPAPDFSATTLDGRRVSLADFHGQKRIVLAFWASWCGPCRIEMPDLIKFYKRNHSESSDFEILAVSIDHEPKDAAEFAAAQKMIFPVLLDSSERMADDYAVYSIPTLLVIDKNGKIVYGHSGYSASMEYRLASELGIKKPAPAAGDE